MNYPFLLLFRKRAGASQQELITGFNPAPVAFARASVGTRVSQQGLLVTENADTRRYDYDSGALLGLLYEPQRTNNVSNSGFSGAAVGTALPTGWSAENLNGLTRTITAVGTENGRPYIDMRLVGTATGSLYRLNCASTATASSGQTWASSVFARVSGGSTSGVTAARIGIREYGGSYSFAETDLDLAASGLVRKTVTRNWTTSYPAALYIRVNTTIGEAVDVTLRLACPQLEMGTAASSVILTTGSVATRAADQLSFNVPSGISTLRYVFDDSSTQDVAVSAGAYTVPTNLNRPHLKSIQGMGG